ncbi:MAG: hypothetical protein ACKVG6_10680 [Alphaproteobacteria bacterium]|jgi:hypothetical protein
MEMFLESAQAVAALERVITADTSVTHLAGARGSSIWLMLPFAADYVGSGIVRLVPSIQQCDCFDKARRAIGPRWSMMLS